LEHQLTKDRVRAEGDAGDRGAARPSGSLNVTKTWLNAIRTSGALTRDSTLTLGGFLDLQAERFGPAPALLSAEASLTYAELAAQSRRYTRWALAAGLGKGKHVALLAPNSPDYFALWVGVSRTGAIVSLINTHLRGEALTHSLRVAAPDLLLVHPAYIGEVFQVLEAPAAHVLAIGGDRFPDGVQGLDLAAVSGAPFDDGRAPITAQDATALHIFTSGTTGLPKAARISHRRIMAWIGWFSGLMAAGPQDRLYNCLPMYHSVGGVTAIGAMLASGGSVVVRERFSARQFWPDVVNWECTIVQYIGELWRYLLSASPHPDERRHRLRLICGGGLSEAVWKKAVDRFAIPSVLEFYASTEGSVSLFNVEARPGAIGRAPPFPLARPPAVLARIDTLTGEPIRGPDGFCIPCAPGEIGEAIGRIEPEASGASAFEGYTERGASEAKRLRNAFEPNDLWYRTGDLMRKDEAGFFYFVDRAGDTFRWKGENGSAQEVADILALTPGVLQAAVYAVAVPAREGRAPMAALAVDATFTFEALAVRAAQHLPIHARPVFVRLVERLPTTATYKVQTRSMAAEGFDPETVEQAYWFDPAEQAFRRLNQAAFQKIVSGDARL